MRSFDEIIPCIAYNIVIREEYFGGLVFNKSTVNVYEINKESYKLLNLIDGKRSLRDIMSLYQKNRCDAKSFLFKLHSNGIILW